jgi:uncharacterized protein (TIGR03546 family)
MFFVLRPLRLFLKACVTESTPLQMSYGLALGVLVGLVPKGNLLAIGLGLLLAATRVNLAIAASAAVAVSFAAVMCDPLFDRIGTAVLTAPSLRSFWTSLSETAFVPWTDFNNTVVMGSFLCGLTLFWPLHWLSRPFFARYVPRITERARKWKLVRILAGAEWADRLSGAGTS